MELNIYRAFISKLLETKDWSFVKDQQIKAYYFPSVEDKKIFRFIEDFTLKNGEVPSVRIVKKNFPNYKFEYYTNAEGNLVIGTEEPLSYWCDEIRNALKHNTIVNTLEKMAVELEKFNTEKAYDLMKKSILYIENEVVLSSRIDITKDIEDRKRLYEERKKNQGIIGIPSGIPPLDNLLKGWQKKQLITMIATTGTGKSWFEVLIGCHALLNNYRVLQLTTEMSEEMFRDRYEAVLVGMLLGDFNYERFRSGRLTKEEEEKYYTLLDKYLPRMESLIIDMATGVSAVSAKIDEFKPDLVLIDSAYLMEDDRGAKEDWLRVAHITRDLHTLAKLKNIPIFINSQADSTTSKKTGPELENIGYSRAVGQDCLPANTTIVTDEGIRLIQHLEGEVFKVFNGETYNKAICKYAGEKEQIHIKFKGNTFTCSPNHKIYVYDSQVNDFVWKKAKDIEPNIDYVLENNNVIDGGYPHILQVVSQRGRKDIKIPMEATYELGKLIGMFIGDGSIKPYDKGQVTISCGYDEEYAKECIYLVEKYFNLRGVIKYQKTKLSKKEQLMPTWYSKKFSDWLKFMIEPEGYKTLRPDFLEMNLQFRSGLLAGLIQSDGSVKGQVEITSIHKELIDNVRKLCISLGINTKIDEQSVYNTKKYRIRLRSKDLKKVNIQLTSEKQANFNKLANSKANGGMKFPEYYVKNIMECALINIFPPNIQSSMYLARRTGKCSHEILKLAEQSLGITTSTNYKLIPVDEVIYDNTKVPMWDIQVLSDDKRIITDGIVSHNSDVVLALFQDQQMREDKEMKIKVLKQREGKLGYVMMEWDLERMRFKPIYSSNESGDEESNYTTSNEIINLDD